MHETQWLRKARACLYCPGRFVFLQVYITVESHLHSFCIHRPPTVNTRKTETIPLENCLVKLYGKQ